MFATRARLLDLIADPVDAPVLVEAGGGMGKTVLADQIVERWPDRAIRLSGSEIAGLLDRVGDPGPPDRGGGEPSPLVVVDDVQLLPPPAVDALVDLVERHCAGHRLIALGRMVPVPLRRAIERATKRPTEGVTVIDAARMLLDRDELESLIGDPNTARSVELLTAGWPIAVAELLGELARGGSEPDPRLLARRTTVVDRLLMDQVAELDPPAILDLGRLAYVTTFDRSLLDALGPGDTLDRMRTVGVPLVAAGSGGYAIPLPIRQALRRQVTVPTDELEPLVSALLDRDDIVAAIDVCAQAGWPDRAAAVLGGLTPDQIYSTDAGRLRNLFSVLGSGIRTEPAALLAMARISGTVGETEEMRSSLERAMELADERDPATEDPRHREVLAELAFVEYQAGNFTRAAKLRDRGAELVSDTETTAARARLLETAAGLLAQEKRRADLVEAKGLFADAITIWNRLGYVTRSGASLRFLVWYVLFELGHHREALELLDRALASGGVTSVETALNHLGRARCLGALGRAAEAEAALIEAEALIASLDIGWAEALAHWIRAVNLSYVGDGDRVQAEIDRAASAMGAQADGPNGARFRSEAAVALARCGRREAARAQLGRAEGVEAGDPSDVALAAASLEARFGDGPTALGLLARLGDEIPVPPGEGWMVAALTAAVYHRMGQVDDAGRHLDRARSLAAEAGNPDIVSVVEGRLLAGLLDAGSEPAGRPARAPAPVDVGLFGPFTVRVDGEAVDLSRGHGATILKLLVLNGGHLHVEAAIDALWPEATVSIGKRRLRNVLRRLRTIRDGLVERDGDVLRLGPGVDSDYGRTRRSMDRLLHATPAVVDVGAALELLGGDLVPGDRYADWADERRLALDHDRLRVLDHLVDPVLAAADVDGAVVLLERAIELAPHESFRVERAAAILIEAGREEAARALRERARRVG